MPGTAPQGGTLGTGGSGAGCLSNCIGPPAPGPGGSTGSTASAGGLMATSSRQPSSSIPSSSQGNSSSTTGKLETTRALNNDLKAVVIEAKTVSKEDDKRLMTSSKTVAASVEPCPKTEARPTREQPQPLILERPKRISFSTNNIRLDPVTKLDPALDLEASPVANGNGVRQEQASSGPPQQALVSRETITSPRRPSSVSSLSKKEDLSPGTPCSQCLRQKHQKLKSSPSPLVDHNGGQEFFGSSEECCSSWSGCCNSSCGGSCGDQAFTSSNNQTSTTQQRQSSSQQPQQPLSALVMQQHEVKSVATGTTNELGSCKLSLSTGEDVSRGSHASRVATISCPQFENSSNNRLLSKISRSVPEDLPACNLDEMEQNQRHLVTFVTPSMETIPLEMCQDIPDVLI